jgi:hypothetical protein
VNRLGRSIPKLAFGISMLLGAGCATEDSSTSPSVPVAMPATPSTLQLTGPTASVDPSDTLVAIFTVPPLGGTFQLGEHIVRFPANTICDPAGSSYGPGEWMKPCPKITASITITAALWTDLDGHPRVDFTPSLRFTPAGLFGELPAIYLHDPNAALLNLSGISYCPTLLSTACVNEALSDLLLLTWRDPETGYLYRFIRHFSGYVVWA